MLVYANIQVLYVGLVQLVFGHLGEITNIWLNILKILFRKIP